MTKVNTLIVTASREELRLAKEQSRFPPWLQPCPIRCHELEPIGCYQRESPLNAEPGFDNDKELGQIIDAHA